MFLVLVIFLSAVSISITAAYFSIIGLATMFPGSKEAIIIMGATLEIGKLVAAVWLHKEWHTAFKFIRNYLLIAVIVLSAITSMGIFGFLSRSHVEHEASIEKEQAMLSQIEVKIQREKDFINRKSELINKIESKESNVNNQGQDLVKRLEERINAIKEESELNIKQQQDLISKNELKLKQLDEQLESAKGSGLFSNDKNYKKTLAEQKTQREFITSSISESESEIKSIQSRTLSLLESTRAQIDSASAQKDIAVELNPDISKYNKEIQDAQDNIATLESESFQYGQGLRALETEMGPITYIIEAIKDWTGADLDTGKGIRIVIITLIFVFDPLAILLLIAATMSYSEIKRKKEAGNIPPDVRAIRNKLLEEMEEYMQEGGIAEHFIERAKK
jgi:hypothetical protein